MKTWSADHDVVAAGVVTSSMRFPSKLAVLEVPARELTARAEAAWGWHPETLGQALAELGCSLGSPWQKDHKDATVAWLAMPS